MTHGKHVRKNVLIAFPISRIARTDKLAGIFHYLSGSDRWQIRVSDVDTLNLDGIDGMIITGHPSSTAMRQLEEARIPTVTIAIPCRCRTGILRVETNGIAIARTVCAEFVSRQHYASLVLVSGKHPASCFDATRNEMRRFAREHSLSFAEFSERIDPIVNLPRPIAAFALNDILAHDTVLAGLAANIRIPDDLSVIGFGNESVFCESIRPSISSVDLDFKKQGFTAAQLLDSLMSGKAARRKSVVAIGPKSVIHRESTPERKAGSNLAKRALAFIDQKATDGITVQDVVAEMRVSRRLLELRFHESAGISILTAILNRRLDATKSALKSSDDPISIVCEQCGWKSENYPKRLFKRRFGMTMNTFRKQNTPPRTSPILTGQE